MNLIQKNISLKTFILTNKINDDSVLNNLLEDIYKNKFFFTKQTNVHGLHSKFDFLNNNIHFHNFLHIIKPDIQKIWTSPFIIHEVWSNIYNNENHFAQPHSHSGSNAFCGILYLTNGPGPGTYFPEYDLTIEEEKGKFVLFHCNLIHEVKKFKYCKDRVTVAFNFNDVGFIENNINIKKI